MTARWLAFVIWAAVAAAAVFWALRLLVPGQHAPAHTVTVGMAPSVKSDLRAVLGVDEKPAVAEAAAPVVDARFQLVGVVSPRGSAGRGEGVALIAVDGKPARAYRVGAAVEGDTVLQAVSARGAALGPRGGAAAVSLEIPALPPPATGTMPTAVSGGTGPQAAPGVRVPGFAPGRPFQGNLPVAPLPASPPPPVDTPPDQQQMQRQ